MQRIIDNELQRGSGILLHISSLPSKYGIGTFGKEAYHFVDFLAEAKQKYWQILPLTPTGYGDSPYQSFSTFAVNPYFIDLDLLVKQGLLNYRQINAEFWGNDKSKVDYGAIYYSKDRILRKAFEKADDKLLKKVKAFTKTMPWLPDYALFITLKNLHGGIALENWAKPYVDREPKYINSVKRKYADDITYQCFLQYLAFTQYLSLKEYANSKGISIIGDMPIYLSMDSADVWSNRECFQLDENLMPEKVAGVPPDYFSETGQLWGNPLYDYEYMRGNHYEFWHRRFLALSKLYDIIRIDHFRGFEAYYTVPASETTAINGSWVKGEGRALFDDAMQDCKVKIIAEDLGVITDEVRSLRDELGFPGMKVLCFAFGDANDTAHEYKPRNYVENCIAYINTHDNDTLYGFFENGGYEVDNAMLYYGIENKNYDKLYSAMLKDLTCSKANVAILSMQDILKLGTESRMNTPSTSSGNWQYRLTSLNYLRKAGFLAKLTEKAKR